MEQTIQTTEKDFYMKYLSVINGGLGLSQKEILILGELIKYYLIFPEDPEYAFSSHIRKKIQLELNVTQYNFNNYIQALKNKKALYLTKEGKLRIHPVLIPKVVEGKTSVIFNFVIN